MRLNECGSPRTRVDVAEPAPLLFSETHFGAAQKYAVRAGTWKLIVNRDRRPLWRAGVPLELYDLAADPGEKQNVAAAKTVIAGYLRRRLVHS